MLFSPTDPALTYPWGRKGRQERRKIWFRKFCFCGNWNYRSSKKQTRCSKNGGEQKYIDLLKPKYNIAQIAGSLLNTKWSTESKLRLKKSTKMKQHLPLGESSTFWSRKPVTEETPPLANGLWPLANGHWNGCFT